MRHLLGAIRLIRPLNGLIAVASLLTAVVVASGKFSFPARESMASFFITSFGYAINDLFDFCADKINKPTRVIPSRTLSAWQAINVALICLVFGFAILAGADIRIVLFFIAVSTALFFYSFRISGILVLSNVWVALLCSLAFYLGGLVTEASIVNWPLLYAGMIFTFLYHLGREIIKDIEDIEGDRYAGRKTLPIVWGERKSELVAAIVFAMMILSTYSAHVTLHLSQAFLFAVTFVVNLPIVVIFAFFVFRRGEAHIRRASVGLKAVMLPALVSLLLAGLKRA